MTEPIVARSPISKSMRLSGLLCGVLLIGSGLVSSLRAQSTAPATKRAQAVAPVPSATPSDNLPSVPRRERAYYGVFWGVDSLRAKAVESGELIQFSYRVLDPDKAKPLNDTKSEAYLIAPDAHAKLIIPSLEKVGQLRQTSTPEAGKLYWMAFSNPGRVVKKGERVNVVIGQFHVEGLPVE
jgi:hypothetical protein